MGFISCPRQYDRGTRLMAAKSISRLNDRRDVRMLRDETQRVLSLDNSGFKVSVTNEFLHNLAENIGLTQCTAHRKHDLGCDIVLDGQGKYRFSRAWVQHVETHHDHIEKIFRQGNLQHPVSRVPTKSLRDPQEANLAQILLFDERRKNFIDTVRVLLKADAVQIKHIDIVRLQALQALLKGLNHVIRREHVTTPTG